MATKVRDTPESRSLYDNGSESTVVDETTALLDSDGNYNGTSEGGPPTASRDRKPSDAGSDAPRYILWQASRLGRHTQHMGLDLPPR